jgi:hypothetical protein
VGILDYSKTQAETSLTTATSKSSINLENNTFNNIASRKGARAAQALPPREDAKFYFFLCVLSAFA